MTKKRQQSSHQPDTLAITEAYAAAKRLTDRMGLRVDRQIFDSVVALKAHQFNTTGSCGGHLRRGVSAPWIDIGVVPSAQLPKNTGILHRSNLNAQKRMIALLNKFYRAHIASNDMRIILIPVGIFGGFRVANQAADIQQLLPEHSKRRRLKRFQQEFHSFAKFLENSY